MVGRGPAARRRSAGAPPRGDRLRLELHRDHALHLARGAGRREHLVDRGGPQLPARSTAVLAGTAARAPRLPVVDRARPGGGRQGRRRRHLQSPGAPAQLRPRLQHARRTPAGGRARSPLATAGGDGPRRRVAGGRARSRASGRARRSPHQGAGPGAGRQRRSGDAGARGRRRAGAAGAPRRRHSARRGLALAAALGAAHPDDLALCAVGGSAGARPRLARAGPRHHAGSRRAAGSERRRAGLPRRHGAAGAGDGGTAAGGGAGDGRGGPRAACRATARLCRRLAPARRGAVRSHAGRAAVAAGRRRRRPVRDAEPARGALGSLAHGLGPDLPDRRGVVGDPLSGRSARALGS